MLKKIIKDFSIYGISPFITKLGSYIVLPLITPFLTKQDYGVYGVISAYNGGMLIFYTLGLQVNLSNSFFKSRFQFKWLWKQIYGFLTLWSIVYCILLSFILYYVFPKEALNNRFTIIVLNIIPILIFGPLTEMATLFYQYNKKSTSISKRNIVFGLFSAFLTYYFIGVLNMGYMGWFWTIFIVSILTNLSWWIPFNIEHKMGPIINFKRKTIIKALKVSMPVVPHVNALFLLNQSDRIVMNSLKVDLGSIGQYNLAYSFSNIFETFGYAFSNTIIPYVNDLINKKREHELRKIFFISQILFFFVLLLYASFSKEIFFLVVRNKELSDVYQLSVLISMSICFRPMYMACNLRLFYHEKTKLISMYSFIAGIINIIGNIIFIPILGIEAAAITTFLGFMFLSYSRFWTKEYQNLGIIDYYPLTWMLLSILVCLIGYYISVESFLVRSLFAFLLSISLVMILLKFKNNDTKVKYIN